VHRLLLLVLSILTVSAMEWQALPVPGPALTTVEAAWQAATDALPPPDGAKTQDDWVGVERNLRWFKRHQSPDGSWRALGYPVNCPLAGAKAEPEQPGGEWSVGGIDRDGLMTGFALLGYLGAGYDHRTPNKYRRVVAGALEWLTQRSIRNPGDLGFTNHFTRAVVAMALCEAYAMTNDQKLRAPAQAMIDDLGRRALTHERALLTEVAGWAVDDESTVVDLQATLLATMSMKSAQAGGLNVRRNLTGLRAWFSELIAVCDAELVAKDRRDFLLPARVTVDFSRAHGDASCEALALAVFLGLRPADEPLLLALAHRAAGLIGPRQPADPFRTYTATLGIFQIGAPWWPIVQGPMRRAHWQPDPQ
jgi:hypothetical protein